MKKGEGGGVGGYDKIWRVIGGYKHAQKDPKHQTSVVRALGGGSAFMPVDWAKQTRGAREDSGARNPKLVDLKGT